LYKEYYNPKGEKQSKTVKTFHFMLFYFILLYLFIYLFCYKMFYYSFYLQLLQKKKKIQFLTKKDNAFTSKMKIIIDIDKEK
jgi:uncharacterized membrane protein SpoIIM required for sporulation